MTTSESELPPGTLVDHRYFIRGVLGQGGFGRTYLAADQRRFGELCVLKEFIPKDRRDSVFAQKLRELFQREAAILHKLDHPQIPKFFASFEEDGRLFIVQEYVDGKTYWKALKERQKQGQTFTEAEVIQWLRDLLRVLNYIHRQKIVHRDISPDNVMLPDGKNLPVLIDFGVVKQATTHLHGISADDMDGLIQASVSVGKFGYAPYEQIRMGQCSPRSDIYALGVTAVVLLTGKPPNQLIDPRTLEWRWQYHVRIDRRLERILSRMMAEKPQERYSSAQAVFRDLRLLEQPSSDSTAVQQPSRVQHGSSSSAWSRGSSPTTRNRSTVSLQAVGVHLVQTTADFPGLSTEIEPTPIETHVQPDWNSAGNRSPSLNPSPISPIAPLSGAPPVTNLKVYVGGKSDRSRKPLLTALMVGSLALLPIAGGFLGMQSPYIASLCRVLNNCNADQRFAERYQHAIDQATAAQVMADSATDLPTLQRASDQLSEAIAHLNAIAPDAKIYPQVERSLPQYRTSLQQLEAQLSDQQRAAELFERAGRIAQIATEQMKLATNLQAYEAVKQQWRRALATLEAVPRETFVAEQAATRSQEYRDKITELDRLLAARPAQSAPVSPVVPAAQSSVPLPVTPSAAIPRSTSPVAAATPTRPQSPSIPTTAIPRIQSIPAQVQPIRPRSSVSSSATPRVSTVSPVRTTQPPRSLQPAQSTQPARTTQPARITQPARSNSFSGAIALAANQTLTHVSIRLENARVSPSGTLVASLVIENRSDRVFGFVPLFAEVRDSAGRVVRSRVLINNGRDSTVSPGGALQGQLFLLDRQWNRSGTQNMTLIIREGTTGSRTFQIRF